MSFLNIIRAQELKKRKLKAAQAAFTQNACTGKACACR
jgi:hypothetical protein